MPKPRNTTPAVSHAPIVHTGMFRAIGRQKTLADEIAFTLREKIRSGELVPGAQLPTEAALAEAFGVSRNVVREAVARLKLGGFIETLHGIGSFVAPEAAQKVFRIEEADLLDPVQLRHIFELRLELETAAAGMAALNRTDADIARLRAALDAANQRAADLDQGSEAVTGFHNAIAAATGNPYFTDLMHYLQGSLHRAIRTARRKVVVSAEKLRIGIDEHEAICAAICAGDAAGARAAMRRHLENAMQRQGLMSQDEPGA